MAKAWLRDRWEMLIDVLSPLTAADEQRIKEICEEEIAYWRALPSMKSHVSLKEPMLNTRAHLRTALPVTDDNSFLDARSNKRVHLALRYMNYPREEWKAFNKPSEDQAKKRRENVRLIDDPYAVVDRAASLLDSSDWVKIAVGLGAVTGRRLGEVMGVGELSPKTMYTALFTGQLKRSDALLAPYEIPLLLPSGVVLVAWSRLRGMVDCSGMEEDLISKTYGVRLSEAALEHFGGLIPERYQAKKGKKGLYFHALRSAYAAIAVNWFCPIPVHDLEYRPAILGQYWTNEGELERDVQAGLYYADYAISDGMGNRDGRHGTRLQEMGVEVIEVFNNLDDTIPAIERSKRAMDTINPTLQLESKGQTDFSMYKPTKATRAKLDAVQAEIAQKREVRLNQVSQDDVLVLLLEDHAVASAMQQVTSEPLAGLLALLQDAVNDSQTPIAYLQQMLTDKRKFKASYEGRHAGRNYRAMKTSELVKHKTEDATHERYNRAVTVIMKHNDSTNIPERRVYINAAALVEFVAGAPATAKKYLDSRPDVKEHHEKYKLTPGYNRGLPITERVKVPDDPKDIYGETEE
jgi:hypothetical protein